MTLLSLASRQIWPQVLGFLQLEPRPERLVLFHTEEEAESAGPARRLRDLFASEQLLPADAVELVRLPHDDYAQVIEALGATAERLNLDERNTRLHFTGGNKLMAMAAVEWCRLTGTPCFYLERDLRVFPFLPRGLDLLPQESFQLDPHLARHLEPLGLLRCQLSAADVVDPGQRLTLNDRGQRLPEVELIPLLQRGEDFRKFFAWDRPEPENHAGFALEFATAAVLLKLGVPVVQRSVRLAPRVLSGSRLEEGELDLVFNWGGKLWVVDCKDRRSAQDRVDQLRTEILRETTLNSRIAELLNRLEDELRQRDLHPLKEDLLSVADVGGVLGRGVCVRRTPLPMQAAEFARSRRLAIVCKDRLVAELRSELFPKEPASLEQLRTLAGARTRAASGGA